MGGGYLVIARNQQESRHVEHARVSDSKTKIESDGMHHYSEPDLPSPRSAPTIVPTIAEEKEALAKKRKRDGKNRTAPRHGHHPSPLNPTKLIRKKNVW